MSHKPPRYIDGIPVHADGKWMYKKEGKKDEEIITLRPDDEDDSSLWEFNTVTGRTYKMFDSDGEEV